MTRPVEQDTCRTVLGIDAAWTSTQPSGVALAVEEGGTWRLHRVAASYTAFAAGEGARPPHTARGLIDAVVRRTGCRPDVVAVDMPLSRLPITCRRAADDAVSRAYGPRHCSTHTPSELRPGRISDEFRAGFEAEGYSLATTSWSTPALIEVYPHPALVELTRAPQRLPYKAGRVRKYWPELTPAARREALVRTWSEIVAALGRVLDGLGDALPLPNCNAAGRELKAFEDQLDAVVCAWCGIRALDGRAAAFGNSEAAIWIPVGTA